MKRKILFLVLGVVFLLHVSLTAQAPYKLPPQDVVDIVDAPPTPRVSISPDGEMMLLIDYQSMPDIEYMAQPLLRIAGMRITPNNNCRQQTTFYTGLTLKNLNSMSVKEINLPEGAKLGFPRWSADGKWIAFLRYLDNGAELWVADVNSGKAQALTSANINATITGGFTWMPDNLHLLVNMIPDDRGAPPEKPLAPVGPTIQETSGKVAKVWTYQDLLENPYDEKLFDYYCTSQLAEINVSTGNLKKIGKPGIYPMSDPSPGGDYLLVHKIKKPYSYMVPYYYFTHTMEAWDKNGNLVKVIAELPLADEVPMRGVPTGPRSFEWQPLKPANLIWIEALDEGDPEKTVPHRDKIMTLSAPFTDDPKEVLRITNRYSGFDWLDKEGMALITERDWKKKWITTYLVNTDKPETEPVKIFDRNYQDRYNAPGSPVYKTTKNGERVAILKDNHIYLSGRGASPQGDRPFLDKMNVKTMKTERLFHCGENSYETFEDFVGEPGNKIIISYETKTKPPNYYLVNLNSKERKKLTDFKDPAPQLTGVKKQLIKYNREDGVELSGTLYLPLDYKEGEKRPMVVWAYPREYNDPNIAGQVSGSPNRFTFYRGYSQLFFITQGYVLLDDAQMPVVGDPKTMNDTFREQLVANAVAAIDKVDDMGYIDRNRVGIGGHSYGAFMTANLLAHSDIFAAGIARSGAYNRTLTPFGFQNERRTLWEAPELYFYISPFMHADKINEPILLIHGEADNNSGTFPIQSRRMYHALKGHGATARLVMLPHESHGYRARESVLHVLAEMFDWFDKYLKDQ